MEACCTVETRAAEGPAACPKCSRTGTSVKTVTLKALLRPAGLARREGTGYRFCPAPDCPVVYFGAGGVFREEDVAVPVFQKVPPGNRTACYCLAITEADIRREIEEQGRSTASERITALVEANRCACELRNPQGRCCLGNVASVVRTALAERGPVTAGSER